jgi:hypothetical protein
LRKGVKLVVWEKDPRESVVWCGVIREEREKRALEV